MALQALAQDQSRADNWNRAAIACLQNGNLEAAVEHIGQAITLEPQDVLNYSNRARILFAMGQPEAALRDYDQAIELEPTPALYSSRAVVHAALDHTGATLHDLTAAIELDPSAENFLNRAAFFANKGMASDALLNLNRVIELDPTNPNHRLTRANLAFATNRFDLGLEDVEQALAHDLDGPLTFGLQQLADQLEAQLAHSPQPQISRRLIDLIRSK